MSEIDIQNAKQIRDPMDVLIEMELDDDVTLSYSGYSGSAKVADGELDEPTWPMRKLADLQGGGFPLGGSRVLYDSSTSPSQTNGKLGVRGNVGEAVTITITGNKSIASIFISATGAESVTFGSTTTPIFNNVVTIPVGATSITITLNPASETTRIEVSQIEAGAKFKITNENLIRATVSLRSDLSLFNQTLPESEINIEAYQDADISEAVATIPADTPIIYQAGYNGDMGPERKFYVTGQVTWADNVLSIHGVDAVHFLDDVNIVAPVTDKDSDYFFNASRYVLKCAGIAPKVDYNTDWWNGSYRWIIPEGTNGRTLLAFLNQAFNLTDKNGDLLDGSSRLKSQLRFSYIDAGIPTLRTRKDSGTPRKIREEDCADLKKSIEPITGAVTANWKRLTSDSSAVDEGKIAKVGTATLLKGIGTSIKFDEYTFDWKIGLYEGRNYDNDIATKMLNKYGTLFGWGYMLDVVPAEVSGDGNGYAGSINTPYVGRKLAYGEIPQEAFNDYPDGTTVSYSSFIPWSQSYNRWRYDEYSSHVITSANQMWDVLRGAGIIDSTAESLDLEIYGFAYYTDVQTKTYTTAPEYDTYDYGDAPIHGRIAAKTNNDSAVEIYPEKMLSVPMHRSNITGSFTWKGDPRMQPRDVVEWERLDGTTTPITLENITLIHEGGGTMAEITYREGDI